MTELHADGTRKTHLTPDQFARINSVLGDFFQKTKCPAIMLADSSGLLIGHQGSLEPPILPLLAAVAAANYSATGELARLINEPAGFSAHLHEGQCSCVFMAEAADGFFLVVVYSRSTPFELVHDLVSTTAEELAAVLGEPSAAQTGPAGAITAQHAQALQSSADLLRELSSQLDELFSAAPEK